MRVFNVLLHLYPTSFRTEYGRDMQAIFAARRRQASGAIAVMALWVETLSDVGANAARMHGDILWQDLRYCARTLGRTPGFVGTVLLVSALGIGGTTATFSIADHVLIRSLPFADANRLVRLWEDQSFRGYARMDVSPANYADWQRLSSVFEGMAAYRGLSVALVGQGDPERLDGASVTAELLPMLGARAALGRLLTPEDDRDGAPSTLLLSDRLWHGKFGADPGVLGRTVRLDGAPYTIVGVMPAEFDFPTRDVALWTPMRFAPQDFQDRTNTYLHVLARLKPGVEVPRARADMVLVARQLEQKYPRENAKTGVTLVGLQGDVSPQSRLLLEAVAGASLCMLLIACANLANMLVIRAVARRRELAVRNALGAGRERLVRQMLTESLLLAVIGGVLGVGLAATVVPLLARLVPNSLPIAQTPSVDARMLAVAGLATLVTGLGFGLIPAWRAGHGSGVDGLRESMRVGASRRSERLRSALVVAQVTSSVLLLVSAGLLLRAMWRVQAIDPGFRTEGVLTLRTSLPMPRYQDTLPRGAFYRRVLDDVRVLPGVTDAAYISFLPMVLRGGIWPVSIAGRAPDRAEVRLASLRFVTPRLFSALGIPLRAGRDVRESDTGASTLVAVVSASFARQCWPGESALGRRFEFLGETRTVVGVVGDIRVSGLEYRNEPQVYLPYQQVPDRVLVWFAPKDLVVRAATDPATLVPAILVRLRVPTPSSRCPTFASWGTSFTRRRPLAKRRCECSTSLLPGRSCWRVLASTASSPSPCLPARERSPSESRSGRTRARSSRWSSVGDWNLRRSVSGAALHWGTPRAEPWRRCSQASVPPTAQPLSRPWPSPQASRLWGV
jgi:predicted permease